MSSGRSPGTSDISRVMTRAGWQAAASRPPLIADRWRRTQFISLMVAPLASSARLTACLSRSVRPSSGSGSRAEPPPEIRHSTVSSGRKPLTRSSMRRRAARPRRHRMGGLDDLDARAGRRIAVARDHQARQRPVPAGFDAWAIAAEALPAPMTMTRPPRSVSSAGSCAATQRPAGRRRPWRRTCGAAGRRDCAWLRPAGRSRNWPAAPVRAPAPNDPRPCRGGRR